MRENCLYNGIDLDPSFSKVDMKLLANLKHYPNAYLTRKENIPEKSRQGKSTASFLRTHFITLFHRIFCAFCCKPVSRWKLSKRKSAIN